MQGSSLLGCVARRVGPSLLTSRRDDPNAFLRHLQLIGTDFITHWPKQKSVFTPYNISTSTVLTTTTKVDETKGTEQAQSENSVPFTHANTAKVVDEACTLKTALCFAVGENSSENQAHIFEMSVLLTLLRRPRSDFAETMFWDILIDKLKELDFYELLQQHISKVWKMIKEQQCGPEIFRGLRVLQFYSDILLLFSQHAMYYSPSVNAIRELIIVAQEMWVEDALFILKRCAIVISVFLAKFPTLLPLDQLCNSELNRDAPCYLAVLATIPILRKENGDNLEHLQMALEVVFKTTVYSIPSTAYFYADRSSTAIVSTIRECFASILYEIFLTESNEFWSYFSPESLISITEACANYVSLWGPYPAGMQGLQRHIYSIMVNQNSVYAISLVNFYIATAAVYDITLDELEDSFKLVHNNASRRITYMALVDDVSHSHEGSSHFLIPEESPIKKTFRLLASGCSTFCGDDFRMFLRSSLFLLRTLLSIYLQQLGELERIAGCNIKSLLNTVGAAILTLPIEDTSTLEVMYGIIFRYHYLFENLNYLDSTLLFPEFMKGVGLKCETTEIASLQLRLYSSLLEFKNDAVYPGRVVEALAHIQPGVISHFSLAVPFFLQWLSITETLISESPDSLASLLTFEESHNKLIHRLCEGIFVIIRELQSGSLVLDSHSTASLLEEMIRLLSLAVLDEGRQDVLATCVIATYGEDTLSACFMLYSLIFANHASNSLVECTAGLLAYVVQHSQEKFFTTMRFHTSTEMKRNLFAGLHQLLQPSSTSTTTTTTTTTATTTTTTSSLLLKSSSSSSLNSSLNVIRLASLRCLLQYDPASFYYFVVPEEAEKGVTEIPLVGILRSIIKSPDTVILEKAEALELLRTLNDVSIPLEDVTSLHSNTDCGPPYCKTAFAAAIINYVCGVLFDEIRLESEQLVKSVEKQQKSPKPFRSPSKGSVQGMKNKEIVVHLKEIRTMIRVGCEALLQCTAFYKQAERELRFLDAQDNLTVSEYQSKRNSQKYFVSHSRHYNTSSDLSTTNNYGVVEIAANKACSWDVKLFPILLGVGFLVPQMENDTPTINRVTYALESIKRLTTSLESVLWIANKEKELGLIAPMILEAVLDGISMVEPTVPLLRGLMWDCLNGWLSLGRAAAEVLAQSTADSVLTVSTAKLNPFFQNFVKLLNSNRGSVTVLSQGLGVLSVFQPSDIVDDSTIRQVFELIDDVLGKHRNMAPSNVFFVFISEISATYNRFGNFCSLTSALNTLENLWSCVINVSHKISATESSCALSDFFDHLINAMNTVLLKAGEVSNYFSENQVMNLVTALGQFTQSACYDSVANLYRAQAWHRGWISMLRLLQTLLVCSSRTSSIETISGVADQVMWAKFVSTLASTSPRFQNAISGFTLFNPTVEPKPFSWELEEMQLCTALLDVASSLGVSVSALTPHVRRSFCRIRRYRLQTIGIVEERWLESLLMSTVRHQLSFLLQQPLPPACLADAEGVVVTIERFSAGDENMEEEQLSFDMLRSFTLREMSIIRRGRHDPSASFPSNAISNNSFTTNTNNYNNYNNNTNSNNNNNTNLMNTPASMHSSFATVDAVLDSETGIGPHADNIQLALRLFTRHARFYLRTCCLTLWERRQLAVALEKLLHALSRLIHDVRRLENAKLTWLVDTVREELQSLIGNLQSGS
ncbi:hypothetical protein LSM04_009222 [Trypanosoma melophagium]|uniref:uncharacterized protein n=1 Tax=Trypanosoma melophagium TaxID=715481 RepID=UPI00351A3701|nr:hypothetical protein LSM04_009222 [Trypanosoma melophagium]